MSYVDSQGFADHQLGTIVVIYFMEIYIKSIV